MAPVREPVYAKDEKVLCFHHELLYEAKVIDSKLSDASDKKSPLQYRVHYKGWKNTWDDWVPQDRIRKLSEENKQLAHNLKSEMDALRARSNPKSSSKKKNAGSDLGSPRDSEDRQASIPATGRGQKRGRDNEIEKVRDISSERNSSPSQGPIRKRTRSSRTIRSPAKALPAPQPPAGQRPTRQRPARQRNAPKRPAPQRPAPHRPGSPWQEPALPNLDDLVPYSTGVAIDSDRKILQSTEAGPSQVCSPPLLPHVSGEPSTGSLDLASSYLLRIPESNLPTTQQSLEFTKRAPIIPTSECIEWSSVRTRINADKRNRHEVKIPSNARPTNSALSSPLSSAPASPINSGFTSGTVNVTTSQPALGKDVTAKTTRKKPKTKAGAVSEDQKGQETAAEPSSPDTVAGPSSQDAMSDESGALLGGITERSSASVDSTDAAGSSTAPPVKLREQPRRGRNRKRRHEDDENENENAPASKTQRLGTFDALEIPNQPPSKAQLEETRCGGPNAPIKETRQPRRTRNQKKYTTISRNQPGSSGRIAFYEEVDHDNVMMIAGIPLENPPEDLVPFIREQRRAVMNHGPVTNRDNLQEEHFHSRPAVKIDVPDHIKALLVDDWENVTKNLSLVPLPSEHPVSEILDTYFEEEKHKRRLGSAEADLLEEVVVGTKDYFDKCLGRLLLYRFEREQYFQIRKLWDEGKGEWEGRNTPSTVYGAEHLCRLFVSLPELIAQTNMDAQSVTKLRDEVAKLTSWMGKNSNRWFTAEYEAATQEYIEKARGQ